MSLEALKAVKRAFLNDERWDMTEIGQMVNEAIAEAEKREWVGLEQKDMPDGEDPMFDHPFFTAGMVWAAIKLKEKNT